MLSAAAGWIHSDQGETAGGRHRRSFAPHAAGSAHLHRIRVRVVSGKETVDCVCTRICLLAHFRFIYRFFTTVYLRHRRCRRALDPKVHKTLILRVAVTSCCPVRSDHILCSVTWATDERVAVQWLTREQNYLVVQTYDFDGSSWKEAQVGRRVARMRSRLTQVSLPTRQLSFEQLRNCVFFLV